MSTRSLATAPPKVAVIGYYGHGNFGDDILAHVVLTQVCQTIAPEQVVVSAAPGCYLERWIPGIQCLPLHVILRQHRGPLPLVLFGGGGLFFSFPPSRASTLWGLRKSSTYDFWRLLGWISAFRARKYAFCLGIGPMVGGGGRFLTRIFLRSFEQISVRDPVSLRILSGLHIQQGRLVTDPSIELARTWSAKSRRTPQTVGIIVRWWARGQDITSFLESLLQAARLLRTNQWSVEFICFEAKDWRIVRWLTENHEQVRQWEPGQETIDEFCAYLSRFSVLLSMRAHGIFVGAIVGTTPVGINIEPKLEITARQCGVGNWLLASDSTANEIVSVVEQANAAEPERHDWSNQLSMLSQETTRLRSWLQSA